tara:strand:+ start:197 stop:2698 length:2502 start_codon:yes stop_codon:yes gene_type:complete
MSVIQGIGSDEVSTGFYPFQIDQSLKFVSGDNTYLNKTLGGPTDNKKFTIAFWVKRANLGTHQYIISADDGSNAARIQFQNDDTLQIKAAHTSSGTPVLNYVTTRKFRDVGSWYHIVFAYDSANGTDTSRARLYVNGTEITDFSPYTKAAVNDPILLNSANDHHIGNYALNQNNDLDGYLAQFYLVDGEALTPSTFGETKSDIWVAKNAITAITALSNGFGNNGFYLTFGDSSDIGADSSGKNNNFTSNVFQPDNVVSDSPTKNFATLGGQAIVNHALSEGNLKTTNSTTNHGGTTATFNYPTSGKWYHEVTILAETDDRGQGVGIGNQIGRSSTQWGNYLGLIAYVSSGEKLVDTGYASYGTAHAVGNIIGVAYNADDQELEFYLADAAGQTASSQGTITTAQMDQQVDFNNLTPVAFGRQVTQTFNFGQSTFNGTDGSGSLPTGFSALNTANLANPGIDPADDETPDKYFNSKLYSGNSSTHAITGLEFAPDFVWIKARTEDISHAWFDVLRGTSAAGNDNTALGSDRADAEGNTNGVLSSFDSNGFTLDRGSSNNNNLKEVLTNRSGENYVAWTWKAGGSGSSVGIGSISTGPDVPSIASTVSASTESGFSIVSFAAQSTGSKTVAHGLSSPPEMIIFKSRSNNTGWIIQHTGIADNAFTRFIPFTATASTPNATVSDNTAPTNSVFTIGSGFTSGNYGTNQIAYCFHSVDGYSKVGKWQNNNSTDGTFVFTGFRPQFLLLKNHDDQEKWYIVDNKRSPINIGPPLGQYLSPTAVSDEDGIDAGTATVDFLSNGFKIRTTNAGTGEVSFGTRNYIYLAIADQPFKYSNAR